MARKKKAEGGEGGPAWLVTFSDLMTLLLTFFVLLVSMSSMDEAKVETAMESISQTFSIGKTIDNPLSIENRPVFREPGVMDLEEENMAPLREMVFDDKEKDLQFLENRFVQILSINSEVLFDPGSNELSEQGVVLLDKILPYLMDVDYPILVAGHTSSLRDEEGGAYRPRLGQATADATWLLYWKRAMAVYKHLMLRGMQTSRLSLEAFGQYRARFTVNRAEGRRKNRRVDLVLDKRNRDLGARIDRLRPKEPGSSKYNYNNFEFDLTMPGENRSRRR